MREDLGQRNRSIAKLYTSGQTLAAIGERYGLSRERVRQIVNKQNVPIAKLRERGGRAKTRPMTAAETEAIKLYTAGEYPIDIAPKVGLPIEAVRSAILRSRLKPHGAGRRFDTEERRIKDAEIVAAYLGGLSTPKIIASIEGVNNSPRIYRALKRAGVRAHREPFGLHKRQR